MADIGEPVRRTEIIPIPVPLEEPVIEPVTLPAEPRREREPVPA